MAGDTEGYSRTQTIILAHKHVKANECLRENN